MGLTPFSAAAAFGLGWSLVLGFAERVSLMLVIANLGALAASSVTYILLDKKS